MILFFDRNVGKRIPEAFIRLKLPAEIKYHQNHFAADTPDDDWLKAAGAQERVVISQDLKFH